MCSPSASRTSVDCSITFSESLSDCGNVSMLSAASAASSSSNRLAAASGASSYPSEMPFRPAARMTLNARYGLHAGSGLRYSMRVALGLPRLGIGTRMSPLRLFRAQLMCTGASKPGTNRL